MTKDEILTASPEQLRVMVAEQLGCTVIETDKGPICGCDPDEKDGWPHWDARNIYGALYDWPNDITAAWELAESLDTQVTLFRNQWTDGHWTWHCHIGGPIDDPGDAWAEEPTVPLAICRAWLLANLEGE